MKMNLKKMRMNQVILLIIATVVALYLIKSIRKSEDYEGDAGPAPAPKITQKDLDAVLKFIG
jgi:hypothetical protein